jgi:hypothetical protein
MCGCDYCNQRGIPEPDCCPNCDAVIAKRETDLGAASQLHLDRNEYIAEREQDIRPYRSVTIDGFRVIEYGPVLNPANPHTRFNEVNDYTAGGTA